MSRPTRRTPGGRAYLDLQNRARRENRTTQELLTLYVLERWLARLAVSPHADTFVLKGGLLLAVFNARRPTADADLLARHFSHDQATIADRVRDVARHTLAADDGVDYLTETITIQTIREDADYAGVRITMDCRVSTAAVKLKLDVNVGDPVTPAPQLIELPSQRPDTPAVTVLGYPIETVLAEKPAQRSPSAKPTRGCVTTPTCIPLPADTPCPTPGCAKPCWRPRDTEVSPCYRFPTSSAHSPRYGSLPTMHFDDASVPMAHTCP